MVFFPSLNFNLDRFVLFREDIRQRLAWRISSFVCLWTDQRGDRERCKYVYVCVWSEKQRRVDEWESAIEVWVMCAYVWREERENKRKREGNEIENYNREKKNKQKRPKVSDTTMEWRWANGKATKKEGEDGLMKRPNKAERKVLPASISSSSSSFLFLSLSLSSNWFPSVQLPFSDMSYPVSMLIPFLL